MSCSSYYVSSPPFPVKCSVRDSERCPGHPHPSRTSPLVPDESVFYFRCCLVLTPCLSPAASMDRWFPYHLKAYSFCNDATLAHYPNLDLPSLTPFPAITLNLGPETVCDEHRDEMDHFASIGPNFAAGRFNGNMGGHFVLHEAKRIITMESGDIVLFPPAIMTHSNVSIQPGETRFSMDPFYPGSIVQHWAQGFQSKPHLAITDPAHFKSLQDDIPARLQRGWDMFLTKPDLMRFWDSPALVPS